MSREKCIKLKLKKVVMWRVQKTNFVGDIMIYKPRQSKIEGMKNVSNNNDDGESNILDRGKEKRIQTNDKLDSVYSWKDKELEFALRNSQFVHYPPQFGRHLKTFFIRSNSRPQLSIEEDIEENSLEDFNIPPNNIQVNTRNLKYSLFKIIFLSARIVKITLIILK